jgi:hypothetical protein
MWANWIIRGTLSVASTVGNFFGVTIAGSTIQDGIENSTDKLAKTFKKSTDTAITEVVKSVSPLKYNSKQIAEASIKAADAIEKISEETERAVTVFEKQSTEAIKQIGIVNNNLVEFVHGVVLYIDKEYNTFKGYAFIKFIFSISRDLGFILMSLSLCYNYNENLYNSFAYVLSMFFSNTYLLINSIINITCNTILWILYLSIILLIPILILNIINILGTKYYNHNKKIIEILNNTIQIQQKIQNGHNTKKILEFIDNNKKENEEIRKDYELIKKKFKDLKNNNNFVEEEKTT